MSNPSRLWGLPRWLSGKESTCQRGRHRRPQFDPWVGEIFWRRKWQPTPVFLLGKSLWPEEPGRLQSIGLQRVGHDRAAKPAGLWGYRGAALGLGLRRCLQGEKERQVFQAAGMAGSQSCDLGGLGDQGTGGSESSWTLKAECLALLLGSRPSRL